MSGYNQWSAFYDTYPNPTVAMDEEAFPAYFSHLKNKQVLEIGCGTGRHTQKLLRLENNVTGLDSSSGMLQVAQAKLSEFKRLKLIEGSILTTEFGAAFFDAVVCSLVLEHIENLDVVFKKIARVLKPGGEVFLSEIHPERAKTGALAHFKNPEKPGEDIWLSSYAHTEPDFQTAFETAHLIQVKAKSIVGRETLAKIKPSWEKFLGVAMIKIRVLRLVEPKG